MATLNLMISERRNKNCYAVMNKTLAIFLIHHVSKMVEKYDFRFIMVVLTAFGAISGILKCFTLSRERFWILVFAQVFAGFSQVFTYVMKTRLVMIWFKSTELATATGIVQASYLVGDAASFLLPLAFSSKNHNNLMNSFTNMSIGTAIFATMAFLLVVVFFKEKPTLPANHAERKRKENPKPYIWTFAKGRNFSLLVLHYGFLLSVFNNMIVVLNQIILSRIPDGHMILMVCGVAFVLSGVPAQFFGGMILDKFKNHRLASVLSGGITVISFTGFAIALHYKSTTWMITWTVLYGIFANFTWIIGLDIAMEMMYPLPENRTLSWLTLSSKGFSVLSIYITSILIEKISTISALIFLQSVNLLNYIFLLSLKIQMNRSLSELEHEDK